MKISPIKNFNFKGHGVGEIKALYMQNPNHQPQINIYNQMREIAEKEGFDVFIHDRQDIKNEKLADITKTSNPWGIWAQDNKLLIKKKGETIAVAPEFYNKEELLEVADFCEQTNIKGFFSDLLFEGGNIYLGKRDNGENYFITSAFNMYLSGKYLYFKDKLGGEPEYSALEEFFKKGKFYSENNELIADEEEYEKNWEFWARKAIEIASGDFDVKKENMVFLPEADFHIDMAIRPLEYPYVLVNDDKEVDKLLEKLEKQFMFNPLEKAELKKFKGILAKHRENYSSSSEICKKLEIAGFKPIKIAGAFGRNPVNFINAIVHKNGEDLVYITNSTKHGSKIYQAMQENFEKDLIEKYPKIKRIHYVDGGLYEKKKNNIMYYLGNGNGGIHCLCAEEMK